MVDGFSVAGGTSLPDFLFIQAKRCVAADGELVGKAIGITDDERAGGVIGFGRLVKAVQVGTSLGIIIVTRNIAETSGGPADGNGDIVLPVLCLSERCAGQKEKQRQQTDCLL